MKEKTTPFVRNLQKRFGREAHIIVYDCEVDRGRLDKIWRVIFEKISEAPDRLFVMIITTTGGSFDAARNFYTKVKFYDVNLTTIAVGDCLSAGITLALAGKTRLATKHTQFLLHQSPVDGQRDMSRAEVRRLLTGSRQCDREELAILASNLTIDPRRIKRMVDQETYFSENLAQKIGLVHQII